MNSIFLVCSPEYEATNTKFGIANQLTVIPQSMCELLSCRKLNLDGNPIVDPPEKVWKAGLDAIRAHYNWEKPTGVLSKMIARDDVCTGESSAMSPPSQRLTKSLSVKEKRGK